MVSSKESAKKFNEQNAISSKYTFTFAEKCYTTVCRGCDIVCSVRD